jgi:hypothetical protein
MPIRSPRLRRLRFTLSQSARLYNRRQR